LTNFNIIIVLYIFGLYTLQTPVLLRTKQKKYFFFQKK